MTICGSRSNFPRWHWWAYNVAYELPSEPRIKTMVATAGAAQANLKSSKDSISLVIPPLKKEGKKKHHMVARVFHEPQKAGQRHLVCIVGHKGHHRIPFLWWPRFFPKVTPRSIVHLWYWNQATNKSRKCWLRLTSQAWRVLPFIPCDLT